MVRTINAANCVIANKYLTPSYLIESLTRASSLIHLINKKANTIYLNI